MKTDLTAFAIHHAHAGGHGNNFIIELTGGLGSGCALLALQGILVLGFAADAKTAGDDFRRVQHQHVNVLVLCHQPRIDRPMGVHMFVLNDADRFHAPAHQDIVFIVDNGFGRGGDGHHAGGALTVHGHAAHGDGQIAGKSRQSRDICALGPLRQGAAHDDVFYLSRVQSGPRNGMSDGVASQAG